jgi:hypothetical protein
MNQIATQDDAQRARVARRIHDLLLHELGEDIDIGLLLGPPEYARAVLSLCRSCGSSELAGLCFDFERASAAPAALNDGAR